MISPIDIKWFYKISETGLSIDRKDLHKIIEDPNSKDYYLSMYVLVWIIVIGIIGQRRKRIIIPIQSVFQSLIIKLEMSLLLLNQVKMQLVQRRELDLQSIT